MRASGNRLLFYDMDLVLYDFIAACTPLNLKGLTPSTDIRTLIPDFFSTIATKEWWANVPLTKIAIPLLDYAKEYQGMVHIISRVPAENDVSAVAGKNEALHKLKQMGYTYRAHFVMDIPKYNIEYARYGDVLLDDSEKECKAWEHDGGHPVLFNYLFAKEYPAAYANTLCKTLNKILYP